MSEAVRIKAKPGQSLTAQDGRIIREGEVVEVSPAEADFIVRMGAGEIVSDDGDAQAAPEKAPRKAAR